MSQKARSQKPFARTYDFCGKRAWRPPDTATPFSFWLQKAKFKSFLLMCLLFLCQQWFFQNIEKDWRKIFEIRLFPQFLKITKITKKNSPAFFNILKEPLLLQRQTLYQLKALDLGYQEPKGKGCGCIMRVSRPFDEKSIYCLFFTGAKMVLDSLPSRRSLGNQRCHRTLSFWLQIAEIKSFLQK